MVPPSHPWASRGFAPVEEIAKQHYILYGKRSTTAGIITRYFASMGVTLRSSIELANIEAIIELVAIGMGVSVLTDWVVAEALRKKIVCKIPLGKKSFAAIGASLSSAESGSRSQKKPSWASARPP